MGDPSIRYVPSRLPYQGAAREEGAPCPALPFKNAKDIADTHLLQPQEMPPQTPDLTPLFYLISRSVELFVVFPGDQYHLLKS